MASIESTEFHPSKQTKFLTYPYLPNLKKLEEEK